VQNIDPENRQLDAISRAIGKLEAYIQEFRDGHHTISELIKSNETNSCKRDDDLKNEFMGSLDRELGAIHDQVKDLSKRVGSLEEDRTHRRGAVSVGSWFVKNWPVAGILTALAAVVTWANDKI
jgi:uncharacterized protein YhaN